MTFLADAEVLQALERAAASHRPHGLLVHHKNKVPFDQVWNAHRDTPWVHHWWACRQKARQQGTVPSGSYNATVWKRFALDWSTPDRNDQGVLQNALRERHTSVVKFLLTVGVDPNGEDPSGSLPIGCFSATGWFDADVAMRRALVRAGAEFNAPILRASPRTVLPLDPTHALAAQQTWLMSWAKSASPTPSARRFLVELVAEHGPGPWRREHPVTGQTAWDLLASRAAQSPSMAVLVQDVGTALAAHDHRQIDEATATSPVKPISRRL